VSLAIALSGWPSERFAFFGFPPQKEQERAAFFKGLNSFQGLSVLLETPYRIEKLVGEALKQKKEIFLAIDLNRETETLIRGIGKDFEKKFEMLKSSLAPDSKLRSEAVLVLK
jgi:16S rRNA (cytidine1402-2'-O)-methyltransferase